MIWVEVEMCLCPVQYKQGINSWITLFDMQTVALVKHTFERCYGDCMNIIDTRSNSAEILAKQDKPLQEDYATTGATISVYPQWYYIDLDP